MEYTNGYEAAKRGLPCDTTKSDEWQKGWWDAFAELYTVT